MRTSLCVILLAILAESVNAGVVDVPLQVGGAFAVPVTSQKESRFRSTIRQQYDFSCGSAALSTLLTHHYGYHVTEQMVFMEMFQRGDRRRIQKQGFSLLDMKSYLQHHGFQANGYEATLETLASARIPAIVLLKENGYGHFVVIKGLQGDRVLIGDPANGTRALSRKAFEKIWANHILFVINNKMELARFNVGSDWHAAPRAPLFHGVGESGAASLSLPKFGASDF